MSKPAYSNQRYLQKHNEVVLPQKKKKSRQWVVSRRLCHYRLLTLTDIPLARRENVLQLQIQQWSPFTKYASYSVWRKGQVQVWIWDQQLQQNRLTEVGLKKATVLPEPILRPPPKGDAIQLVQCLEGVEGQIWKEGLLIGSRWWADSPTEMEWAHFQRAHTLPANPTIPPMIEGPLLERPWGRSKKNVGQLAFLYQQSTWITLVAAIFMMLFSWQGVSIFKWQQALAQIQTQIDELNDSVSPILTSRTQALADKQRFEKLLSLNPYPSQLQLMTKVAQQLPAKKARFKSWSYQMGQLKFTIASPNRLDSTYYIKKFQSTRFFNEIKAEAKNNSRRIIMNMGVKPIVK
jgi:hypothetical protein